MFTKTLAALLILASASVALTANAAPIRQDQPNQEYSWMERASRVTDGGN